MPGKMVKLKKGDCIDKGPKCSCGNDSWRVGDYCIECTDCGGKIESKGQIEAVIEDSNRNCGFGDFLIGDRRTKGMNCGGKMEIHPIDK